MRHEGVQSSCRLPGYKSRELIIGSARPPADLVCVHECTSSLTSHGQTLVSGKQVSRVSRHSNVLILLSGERQQLHCFHYWKLMLSGYQPHPTIPQTELQNWIGCILSDTIFIERRFYI